LFALCIPYDIIQTYDAQLGDFLLICAVSDIRSTLLAGEEKLIFPRKGDRHEAHAFPVFVPAFSLHGFLHNLQGHKRSRGRP